uniref:Uncharacterized protein n=1 Tax=Rhizophora mucronata TaxID=61149 RepID=A0A2P2J1R3_RHIMU
MGVSELPSLYTNFFRINMIFDFTSMHYFDLHSKVNF